MARWQCEFHLRDAIWQNNISGIPARPMDARTSLAGPGFDVKRWLMLCLAWMCPAVGLRNALLCCSSFRLRCRFSDLWICGRINAVFDVGDNATYFRADSRQRLPAALRPGEAFTNSERTPQCVCHCKDTRVCTLWAGQRCSETGEGKKKARMMLIYELWPFPVSVHCQEKEWLFVWNRN